MTNGSSQEGNRIFYLSRHRVVFYTIGVFLLSAFVAFWALNLLVGRLWEISWTELLAVLCIAVGAAVLFFIFFKLFAPQPLVSVTESGLTFKKGKKIGFVRYADITSVRENEGLLGRLTKTCKVEIETHLGAFPIYLSADEVQEFFGLIPASREPKKFEPKGRIVSGREKYAGFLSVFVQLTFLLVLVAAVSFPSVAVLLKDLSDACMYLLALLAIYAVLLLGFWIRLIYIVARFTGYAVRIEADRFSISYGKVAKTEHNLFFDCIRAFRLRQTFIDRLLGLCRVSVESAQKAKGISDNNYFPFLMKKEDAETLVFAVMPERPPLAYKKTGRSALLAYAEQSAWFAVIAIILGIFLTPLMLLLLLLPVLFVMISYKNSGYVFGENVAAFRYGVTAENIVFVRYADMRSVTAAKNLSAARNGICDADITVGQFSRVFSVGYMNDTDFSELTEKLEKKVDKDNEILYTL